MAKFKSKCLMCDKEFDNSDVQRRQYCSVGCQYDAGQEINHERIADLESKGFEKPGPNAVTVGDLIGLKREE